jgi:excinuclease ABC subunit C
MGVPAFRLVQQIRDQTHKTAIEFHRKRRETRDFTSELTAIEGVAEKRKMKLLRNFGSIERIAKASIEELSPFLGAKTAKLVFDHFDRQRRLSPTGKD